MASRILPLALAGLLGAVVGATGMLVAEIVLSEAWRSTRGQYPEHDEYVQRAGIDRAKLSVPWDEWGYGTGLVNKTQGQVW